jgi:hypothetical protein
MTWFRCPCGYIAEVEAVTGEIVSVYHLHTDARLDKTAQLSRMEPLPDPVPEPVLVAAGSSHR